MENENTIGSRWKFISCQPDWREKRWLKLFLHQLLCMVNDPSIDDLAPDDWQFIDYRIPYAMAGGGNQYFEE